MSNNLRYSEIMVNNGVLNVEHSFSDVDAETLEQLSWKTNISKPHPHDVLSGRGNSRMNKHPGNQYFRSLVLHFKNEYVIADKDDKPMFAKLIHGHVRALNPPGRFLRRDRNKGEEYSTEMCEKSASEKTRQALREGAAKVKKEIEDGKRKVDTHFRRSLSAALNKAPQTLQSLAQQQTGSSRSIATTSTLSLSASNSTMSTSTSPMNTSTSTMDNGDNSFYIQPLPVDYHQPSLITSMVPEAVLDNLIKLEVHSNNLNGSLMIPTHVLETLQEEEEPEKEITIKALDDNIVQQIVDQERINDRGVIEGNKEFPGGDSATNTFMKAVNSNDDHHTCIPNDSNDSSNNRHYNNAQRCEPTNVYLRNSLMSTNDSAYTEEFLGEDIKPKISFDINSEMKVQEGECNHSGDLEGGPRFNDLYTGKPVRARASLVGPQNHSLYHPDIHKYHYISEVESPTTSYTFMKELQALEDMQGCLKMTEEENRDHESCRAKRKFSNGAEAVNYFCDGNRKSITEFSQFAKRMDRRDSKRALFLLRQSVLSACAELEDLNIFGHEENPSAQSPNVFNDMTTMDHESSRKISWTGSTKQLLETVFGEDNHAMKEILANVLDPACPDKEFMKQLLSSDEGGSDDGNDDNVVEENQAAVHNSISTLSLES